MQELFKKKERFVIGQMSGTSLDGVDLALVHCKGSGINLEINVIDFACYEFSPEIRKKIQQTFAGSTKDVCDLNYELGFLFSDYIQQFIQKNKIHAPKIDLIGLHGQTIYHHHGVSTLQIGEADIIAQQTQIPVVSDFRSADIAVGGCGAPLIPYIDHILFQNRTGSVALQNLGGIGNVTYLPKNITSPIIAFDTGPANMILNELVEVVSQGKDTFDLDGKYSQQGVIAENVLQDLLENPFFKQKPPKSTGREDFGKEYVLQILEKYSSTISIYDLIRTAVSFTCHSIHQAYQSFLPPIDAVYVSGGGANHPIMMQELQQLFGSIPVEKFSSVSPISVDAKEAVGFAIFAHEKFNGTPTNVPTVTGARKQVSLGKISLP
ncbi:MAG: anhydro-N-acetylmuramic acid kinase [bacterium]|jgi:anhydro-N-acetylmuramic acid kinase